MATDALHGATTVEREALELVVEANVRAVLKGLELLNAESFFCAVCLWPQDDESQLDAYPVSACTEADRAALLDATSGRDAFRAAWNPMGFSFEGLPEACDPRAMEGFEEAERSAASALIRHGVTDPPRWVLDRAAREITQRAPKGMVTADFVAYTLDSDFDDALLASLDYAAPPAVAALLRRQGLLP